MNKIVATSFIFASISFSAIAEETTKSNWSFGLDVGKSQVDIGTSELDVDGSGTSYGLSVGYKLNEHFLVKGGYKNFGNVGFNTEVCIGSAGGLLFCPDVNGKIKATGFLGGIEGTAPLNDSFSLIGELGFVNWSADVDVLGESNKLDDGTDFFYGVGVGTKWGSTDVGFGYRGWALSDVDISEIYISFTF